ncbi:hypothetical protein EDB83DRAFT_2680403, partial [Lactarius deliciosus]
MLYSYSIWPKGGYPGRFRSPCHRLGRMHGLTFLSYNGPSTTDSHTLISLQRLYSTLNTSSAQPLSPPHRHFFPAVSTFTDHPGPVDENIPRRRSNMGVVPESS